MNESTTEIEEAEEHERSATIALLEEAKRDGAGDSVQSLALVPIAPPRSVDASVRKLRKGRRGQGFDALWSGDTTGFSTVAEAQRELCRLLVPAFGPDVQRIDEAMHASGILDSSWDIVSKGGRTLGESTIQEAIDDRLDAPTTLVADAVTLDDHFALNAGGVLHRYDRGTYVDDGEHHIERRVKELVTEWRIDDVWSTRLTNEVAAFIGVDAPILWDRPPPDEVNVLNGILDLRSRALRAHTPEFLSPVQLPVSYDSDAACAAWEQQVVATFPDDAHDVAWEIAAFLMNPPDGIQKAVLLVGDGANGKSVYLDGLHAFLGPRNVSNLSLQKLSSDRFAVARLDGKLANICADLPSGHLDDTSVFKAVVGHDSLTGEHKFKTSFEFTPFCGLVFSANQPPRSSDPSHGYFRRCLVVPFERTFDGSAAVDKAELVATLTTPAELSGLLNKALDARDDLQARNDFMRAPSLERAAQDFRAATDEFAVWLERSTEVAPDGWVSKRELHDAYLARCEQKRMPPPTMKAFAQMLVRARRDVGESRKTVDGRRVEVWTGIELLE